MSPAHGAAAGPPTTLRLATRGSPLALWQAEHVRDLLVGLDPALRVEVVPVSTEGDRRTDVPLWRIGGKGVFATEVQAAVLDGRADVAVHSAKDLPARTGEGLTLAAVPRRGDPRDALVGGTLDTLGEGAVVATGSARRRAALARLRPDLRFAELRGNMATRLSKAEGFGAIVVAAVALERLGWSARIDQVLDVDDVVPQVGQGALGLECREDDRPTAELLAAAQDPVSRRAVDAERAFLAELGGDCSLPAGAHATCAATGPVRLRGLLADAVHPTWDTSPAPGGHPERTPAVAVATAEGDDPADVGRALARLLRTDVGSGGP